MSIQEFAANLDWVAAAREWIIECDVEGVEEWSPLRVARVVCREFDGGLEGFILSC